MLPLGIYIHVPFCIAKCPYCDFYSVAYTEELADAYTEAVVRAVETQGYGALTADTLYFGGGTPILLGHRRLGRILAACRRVFGLGEGAEITLEANPAATMRGELEGLAAAGFGRISFGVQSAVDRELRALGRLHTAHEAERAILDAERAGFRHISADLMLGIPHQTERSIQRSVDFLAGLPVEHISAYLLKVEDDTPFGAQKESICGKDADAYDDLLARDYLLAAELLEARGYRQYEISNFARGGAVSRHNLKYWRCAPYLGIGPAAHSFVAGRRFYFPRNLQDFLDAERPFSLTVDDGAGGGAEEQMLLGLRLREGIDPGALGLGEGQSARVLAKARALEAHGLTRIQGDNISLTTRGFLLSNAVIGALLEQLDG